MPKGPIHVMTHKNDARAYLARSVNVAQRWIVFDGQAQVKQLRGELFVAARYIHAKYMRRDDLRKLRYVQLNMNAMHAVNLLITPRNTRSLNLFRACIYVPPELA